MEEPDRAHELLAMAGSVRAKADEEARAMELEAVKIVGERNRNREGEDMEPPERVVARFLEMAMERFDGFVRTGERGRMLTHPCGETMSWSAGFWDWEWRDGFLRRLDTAFGIGTGGVRCAMEEAEGMVADEWHGIKKTLARLAASLGGGNGKEA